MTRRATLPVGWYPTGAAEMRAELEGWRTRESGASPPDDGAKVRACVAPHAGWAFSGPLAAASIARVGGTPDTVVIAGGHLRPHDPVLVSTADEQETPLGRVPGNAELADMLRGRFGAEEISGLDNSTDVLIPMVQYLFPGARVLICRVPPRAEAVELGSELSGYARDTGREVAVIGSTDLTHYGPNFGFTPEGTGEAAYRWVRETNDARFLSALAAMDAETALSRALEEHSACSPGGATASMSFAREQGAERGDVLDHYTSYDIRPGASFVGYGGVVFVG